MSVRSRVFAGWAVLCLAGLVTTSALDAEPSADRPESPAGEATPTGPYAVDCQEIADGIARDRAEAERERREALDPSAAPGRPTATFRTVAVPEECADELEHRGLGRH
ncbi:hypothetical protein [Streptomyces sp. Tu 3180]|uniref:hypothetical protein n=1 Tax=Streptomyces sp. Tu 3180 TaxID=2682611 RepID=UPI001357FC36|nr:hypothetical protein [Streptomyces sp. Tu 3180]KAF3465115.1 hypothetical protein GL259_12710 [Streptomyces sp. Tu 3180]